MRDYLFRGKVLENEFKNDKNTPKWAVGSFHKDPSGFCKITDYKTGGTYGVIPETVGEFIGQEDKIDKPIFEDDIIFIPREAGTFKRDVVGLVIYNNCAYWAIGIDSAFNMVLGMVNIKLIQVIGNKHDNPEFFTGEKLAV